MLIPYSASVAHTEGWNAFFNSVASNPYVEHSQEHKEWTAGYASAFHYQVKDTEEENLESGDY